MSYNQPQTENPWDIRQSKTTLQDSADMIKGSKIGMCCKVRPRPQTAIVKPPRAPPSQKKKVVVVWKDPSKEVTGWEDITDSF
jgi:hypothetical protein